jgi:hypothetical protein
MSALSKAEQSTKLSPDNAIWKKDLALFNGQIGELAP